MTVDAQQQKVVDLRRCLWFLWKRLKDVRSDPALFQSLHQQKVTYSTTAIAEARARLLDLKGH